MIFEDWAGYVGLILKGGWITLQLTAYGFGLAILVAFLMGSGRLSRYSVVRAFCVCYIEFFRGSSLLVQMFWLFYVLPLFGITLPPFTTGVVALGLNVSAYAAEVVRGALLAVPHEQSDASIALNLSWWQRTRHVIVPQAFLIMLPTLGNNAIELMKASATVSLITIPDLSFQAGLVRSATGSTFIPFAIILGIYFLIASTIAAATRRLENRFSAGLDSLRDVR